MKNKTKKIISIILIPIKLSLIALMIFFTYEYLNKVFINKEVDYGEEFKSLPENSIDVLVLGSSDAQYSFVPNFFYEDTGLYSYIRGTPCQPLEVSYEMLKESLKTQSPKLLILEVFTAMPLRSICEDDVCYVVSQYQMTGREKYNTINYLPEEKAKEYRNDFINYHNDWKTRNDYDALLPSKVFEKNNKQNGFFGYVYQDVPEVFPENFWLPSSYNEDIDVELDEMDVISLNNIYELCNNNGIQLLLYKTPIDGITQEDQSYLHKVWEWADEKEIKYIDFIQCARDLKFYMQIHSDSFHCNINGASILTGYISNFVNENYSFNHKDNIELDEKYDESVYSLTENAIVKEYDPLVYLKRLSNVNGLICIRYNPYDDVKIGSGFYNALVELGCSNFDNNNDYYAIINDGKIISESQTALECEVEGHNIMLNSSSVSIDQVVYNFEGPVSVFCMNLPNTSEYILKNIDYLPYPWDYGKDMYVVGW